MDTKELQKEFINWCKANKKSPKSEQETKLLFVSFMKEKHPEEYKAAVENLKKQQLQQAQKAAHGAKLNYFKSLKNQCAEDEEIVYYKKGGSVTCGCKKKEDGGQVNKAQKGSAVLKFKNDYSSKKVKLSQEDYENGIADHEVNKKEYKPIKLLLPPKKLQQTTGTVKKVEYKKLELKLSPKKNSCGGKMKKASCGAVAKFKAARCGSKLKK